MLIILNSIALLAVAGFLIFVFIGLFPFSLFFLFLASVIWLVLSSIAKAFLKVHKKQKQSENIIDIN